jgi:hypothetical protein
MAWVIVTPGWSLSIAWRGWRPLMANASKKQSGALVVELTTY